MTLLTESQQDSLTEIINIAFSRAAASLSDLTQHRVLLNVPKVSIHPMNELQGILSEWVQDEIATVHQMFAGCRSGDALLNSITRSISSNAPVISPKPILDTARYCSERMCRGFILRA